MRFLVDECVGPVVAKWLSEQGHDVFSVYDQTRGADDEAIIRAAAADERILVTGDKHFGDKVYRDQLLHAGVVLLRLSDQGPTTEIAALARLLAAFPDRLQGSFVVVTEYQIRFGKPWRLRIDE